MYLSPPLIYHHITPYGWFRLNLQERLPIEELRLE
jgi:hypothetical protein